MTSLKSNGQAIVITAPSGAGKSTIVRYLLKEFDKLAFSISMTNRPPRDGEINGQDYYFVDSDTFAEYRHNGDLLEYEEIYPGRFYGTLKCELQRLWLCQKVIIFDVDVRGAVRIKESLGQRCFTIFVRPPSLRALEQRLMSRGTENTQTLKDRLERAGIEMSYVDRFDTVLVNDDLPMALQQARQLVVHYLGHA